VRNVLPAVAAFILFAVVPWLSELWGGSYLTSLAMRAMILAIAAISLDLLIGQGGLVSFGHAAFVAIGSYVAGISITDGTTDLLTILAVAIAIAAAFAFITGAISLRTSGVSFIMITLAFGQMVFFTLSALSEYGGDDGLTLWERASAFESDTTLYFSIFACLIASWFLVLRLVGSRFGRVLRAAKQNETRVETLGFSAFGVRLTAYVIAGVIAAIAGVLLANQAEFVSPATAAWQRSGDLIIIVVLGGMGTRSGAVLGALAFVALEEGLSSITHDWRLIFGPLLIFIVLYAKGGLARLVERSP
jgi:branched-chain amino acid transport system permease protein